MGARVRRRRCGAIAGADPAGRALVVTHGGPISAIWLACDGTARRYWQQAGELRPRRDRRRGRPDPMDTLNAVEDYTNKYKGEQVEVALFGGEYQDGVLTAYCYVEDVAHIELNGHILIPLQNIASLHCSSRCDAPEPDWPPQGLAEDEPDERDDEV